MSHLTLFSVDVMLFQGYFFICVNNRNPHHGGQVFIKLVSSRLSSFYLLQISISTRVCESENRPSFLQILHISLCRQQTHASFQHAYFNKSYKESYLKRSDFKNWELGYSLLLF